MDFYFGSVAAYHYFLLNFRFQYKAVIPWGTHGGIDYKKWQYLWLNRI